MNYNIEWISRMRYGFCYQHLKYRLIVITSVDNIQGRMNVFGSGVGGGGGGEGGANNTILCISISLISNIHL